MSKASGKFYIPPIAGIRLIECRDHLALAPVYSFREFYGYGKVKASEVIIELEDGTTEPFWDNCTPNEEAWAVVQWSRFEDGHEEPGSFHYLRWPKTEEDARKAMQEMSDFYSMSKADLLGSPSTFSADEIKKLSKFIDRLRRQHDPVSAFLWQSLSNSEQLVLTNYAPSSPSAKQARDVVVKALNKIIGGPCIYEVERFKDISLWPKIADLVKQNPTGARLARLNRLLLQDAYHVELARQRIGLGQCFAATEDDYAYIESRYPNFQSSADPSAVDEYNVYQARLKVLAGIQPKTVALIHQAEETKDEVQRKKLECEAVKAFFAEVATYWTEDMIEAWLRTNYPGSKWLRVFAKMIEKPECELDPIEHELALNWLRRGYNLMTENELSAAILKATGQHVKPNTVKKKRANLGLPTKRPFGPDPKPYP